MRGLYLGLALAGIVLIGQPAARAKPLATCAPPDNPFDKQVCADPDLRELAREIDNQVDQLRRHRSGNGHHRAYRQINASRRDHERHAQRKQHDFGTVIQNINQHAIESAIAHFYVEKTGSENQIE